MVVVNTTDIMVMATTGTTGGDSTLAARGCWAATTTITTATHRIPGTPSVKENMT